MDIERALRLIAGAFILLSVGFSVIHSMNWLWFTAFVGANLFQSGFTNTCPMVWILRWAGLRRCGENGQ